MDKKFNFKLDKDKIKLQLKDLGEQFKKKGVLRNVGLFILFLALIGTGFLLYSNEQNVNKGFGDLATNEYNYENPLIQFDYGGEVDELNNSQAVTREFALNYPQIGDITDITDDLDRDISSNEEEEVEGVVTEGLRPVIPVQNTNTGIELIKPVSGDILQSPGWYYHTVLEDWRYQQGIEFSGNTGDIVMAAASGQVVSVEEDEYKGILVTLEHENGWITEYGHLERTAVSPGSRVSKGQEIGRIGVTGMTSQPSLYFSLKNKDEAIDPVEFFQ